MAFYIQTGVLVILFLFALKFPRVIKLVYYLEILIQIVMAVAPSNQGFIRAYMVESCIIFVGSYYHFWAAILSSLVPIIAHLSISNILMTKPFAIVAVVAF